MVMQEDPTLFGVGMYVTRGCLVVPVQVELHDDLVPRVQAAILQRINETGIKGVIIDLSGVAVMDSSLARAIFDTAEMAFLLGAKTAITGLRPGVAAALIDLDFEPGDVPTAISLEEGFRILEPVVWPKEALEEAEEPEAEVDEDEEDAAAEDEETEEEENSNDEQ